MEYTKIPENFDFTILFNGFTSKDIEDFDEFLQTIKDKVDHTTHYYTDTIEINGEERNIIVFVILDVHNRVGTIESYENDWASRVTYLDDAQLLKEEYCFKNEWNRIIKNNVENPSYIEYFIDNEKAYVKKLEIYFINGKKSRLVNSGPDEQPSIIAYNEDSSELYEEYWNRNIFIKRVVKVVNNA